MSLAYTYTAVGFYMVTLTVTKDLESDVLARTDCVEVWRY